jgi:hypothetical protein
MYIPLASSQLDLIRYVFVRGPAAAGYLYLALEFYVQGPDRLRTSTFPVVRTIWLSLLFYNSNIKTHR